MRRWTAALAMTVVLAGCGGGEPTETLNQQPAWQGGASADPATPAALTPEEAKRRYLAIVEPYNTALEKLETAANAGKPWRTVRKLAAEVARTNATHAAALRETTWPAAARAPMAALLAENDVALRHWRRAGEAADAEALMREIRAAAAHSGAEEAGRVRAALGLPAYREG
ncbi:hypothetical protein GA0070609_1946 [Micromonospora echinaurantiaca]|uniref:Lipoprotein n=1 Tax=Micromonospora echinaurantiaca TaxID=47857 RepID=A0A1C5HNM8_9ACTN|nr:hypothetical protein [Micromonospora echinaurantiaca]SCG47578.1 hypothetical protein GA0070609_1946 [Micromonospora echinaurantiaca]